MSRGRQKVWFEGLLQENVLGTFKVIRGFADLGDLAEVSVAKFYQEIKDSTGTGYQRKVDDQHVEDIKNFLGKSTRYRFFPEIVLSLWSNGAGDPIVSYFKKRASPNDRSYWVSVKLKALREDEFKRIRRIDGNHRLEAAKRLADEQKRSGGFTGYKKAPFCFVVLDSDRLADDELAEAMLFNLINSKALPIASEHSLTVLTRGDGPGFDEDPQVYLTRWIYDKVKEWPEGFYEGMGDSPLSRLHAAAGVLLRPGGITKATQEGMETEAGHLFSPLYDLTVTLRAQHGGFVHSYAFLPIAAEVYTRHSTVDAAKGANTVPERLRRAEAWLRHFARWFDRVGAAVFPLPADPSVLWTVFKRDYDKRAGQVFVAMSFRESKTLDAVYKAIEEAIGHFNVAHPDTPLNPIRVDKYRGDSFDIPARVFGDIERSCLVIADLTDEKQNVYCEVGYAKARGIPFFLTFRKTGRAATPPNRVHLDLIPYRYIEYEESIELRDKLKTELDAWHVRQI